MEDVFVVDGDTAAEVERQLKTAVDEMEENAKDSVDGGLPPPRGQSADEGRWRRNRVEATAVGADLGGYALVVNGSSLVSARSLL